MIGGENMSSMQAGARSRFRPMMQALLSRRDLVCDLGRLRPARLGVDTCVKRAKSENEGDKRSIHFARWLGKA